ncbi:MAG: hypothetical protein R3B47_10190 [Bacteroidia bacterium]
MKQILTYLLLLAIPALWLATTFQDEKPINIYMIGDSTMYNKPDSLK